VPRRLPPRRGKTPPRAARSLRPLWCSGPRPLGCRQAAARYPAKAPFADRRGFTAARGEGRPPGCRQAAARYPAKAPFADRRGFTSPRGEAPPPIGARRLLSMAALGSPPAENGGVLPGRHLLESQAMGGASRGAENGQQGRVPPAVTGGATRSSGERPARLPDAEL
jgi:hypothetical protein